MPRLPAVSIAVALALGSVPTEAAAATPEEDFLAAENTFRFQDYKAAEAMLRALLYPDVLLGSPEQVTKAHEYLAACYFWLNDERRMEDEFTALLILQPTYKLDPFYYPARLIERFESVRKRLADLHAIEIEPSRKKEPEPARCERHEETISRRHWSQNLIPFGVGQFLSGRNTEGALFLAGQVVGLGLNVGSYIGAQSISDNPTKRKLLISQYVGLGTFLALAAWGIADAFGNFQAEDRSFKVVPCPNPPRPGAALGDGMGVCLTVR